MGRNLRKWCSLLLAVLLYYLIHEGAHLGAALSMQVFRGVRIVQYGLGVQILADISFLSDMQVFLFCIVGVLATLLVGYTLVWQRQPAPLPITPP